MFNVALTESVEKETLKAEKLTVKANWGESGVASSEYMAMQDESPAHNLCSLPIHLKDFSLPARSDRGLSQYVSTLKAPQNTLPPEARES